ncbi:MAG: ABC transporter ATP-binding protein [Microbacteriaceae bacterium]
MATSLELSEALRIDQLVVRYGRGAPVVNGVSLRVRAGETVAIVGESGSGKSTLISAILSMLPEGASIVEGEIEVASAVRADDAAAVHKLHGRYVGYVPQDPMASFNPVTTVVAQSVDADRAHRTTSRKESIARVLEAFAQADLVDRDGTLAKKYPHELSGGMRQRALIATALLHDPVLLLADEPTSALDVITQRRVLDLLAQLTERHGAAVLFVTHDLELALERADRIIVMKDGEIVEEGDPRSIRDLASAPYVREFLAASERFIALPEADRDPVAPDAVPVLSGTGLTKSFGRKRSRAPKALDGVDFALHQGRTLAVVGQSGSGKTTMASIALGLLAADAGEVRWAGRPVASLSRAERARFRRAVQPVFQNPQTSLDPTFSVERTLQESLRTAGVHDRVERAKRVRGLLDDVALPLGVSARLPHELSGGQKQRVAIARSLAMRPQILVCDEPVSALDVIVRAQVLELLQSLQREYQLSMLFISHDLGVVSSIADDVMVLRHGTVVDSGTCLQVFTSPSSDYTRELLAAIPGASTRRGAPAA